MKKITALLLLCLLLVSCGEEHHHHEGPPPPSGFVQINLASDLPGLAPTSDATLINPWGIAQDPSDGTFWIAENGTGLAANFNADGSFTSAPVFAIPPRLNATGRGAPTGVVFNRSSGFVISNGSVSAPSKLLFCTEDGTIAGWNPGVNESNAILAVDNSTGAVFKGLTIADTPSGTFLFAANFFSASVDVFDSNFNLVRSFRGPTIPPGFAPFNIKNFGGDIFVTYARQDASGVNDVPGPGNGFIDVFDTAGNLIQEFATQGPLDSPWGMALAPAGFGDFGNLLLVGNSGDGRINAYDFITGQFFGQLADPNGTPIAIDRLRGLTFDVNGNNVLFFTAGINNGNDGLFGELVPE